MTKILSTMLLTCVSLFVFSQVSDAGLWADISIEKKFNQSFSIEYSNSERFNENISELGSNINEISLKYRLNSNSKFTLTYRLSMKRQLNNMYQPYSRFSLDYTHGFELSDIDVDFRLRFQTRQKNEYLYDYDSDSKNTLRPRIKFKYKVLKFEPYFLAESFHPVWYEEYQPLSKLRLSAGVEYRFNNMHSIDCAYMIQREFFENNPVTDFVVKLGYKFSF